MLVISFFLSWIKIVVTKTRIGKKNGEKTIRKITSFPTRNRTRDLQDASRALYPLHHQYLPLIFHYTSLFYLAFPLLYILFSVKNIIHIAQVDARYQNSSPLSSITSDKWLFFLFPPSSTMPRLPTALAAVTTGNYYYV